MTEFSKNLRKLREDKKISQKSAAASLGVSQALLSHYEKGIRECGLDFLARAAKYYSVTADFLLGLRDDEYTDTDKPADIRDIKKEAGNTYSVSLLYKNLIIHALTYLFDSMKDSKYREVSIVSGKYLSLAVYRLCGILYSGVNEKGEKCDKKGNAANFAERHLISELKCITEIAEMGAPLGEYNFDNVYLNNIIKNYLFNTDA